MHSLDSRSLTYVDCFAQKFEQAGTVRYELTAAASPRLPRGEETFAIRVAKAARRRGSQHHVEVVRVDGRLRANPEQLEIVAGDMVLWNTRDATLAGYAVRGGGAGGEFDSSALRGPAVYTHAFGLPGTFEWVDAHGGKLGGEVVVEAPETDGKRSAARWREALSKGTLVTIKGSTVRPRRVDLVAGQTVFWAVEGAGGVSITDARLIRRVAPERDD